MDESAKVGKSRQKSAKSGKRRQKSAKVGTVILAIVFCPTFAIPTPDKGLAKRVITHKKQKSWERIAKEF